MRTYRRRRGQVVFEYALVLCLLLVLSVPVLRALGKTIYNAIETATAQDSVSALATGTMPTPPPMGPVGHGQDPPIWPAT